MTETDTFAALKFGTFTADDIKHRWVTNDNSKFESLPNEVKVRWLELLRDRYVEKVIPERKTEFFNKTNQYIKRARSGDYSVPFFSFSFPSFVSFVSFFSFSSISFFSFSSTSFSEADFTQEVMNELAIDSSLLNDAIKEFIALQP